MSEITHIQAYGLLSNFVVPRPIAFVSTLGPGGEENIAPFSFFMVGGANPPSVIFSPVLNRDSSEKDTLRNIRNTGEYVINLITRDMADGVNETSAPMPYGDSEWGRSGFTQIPSEIIKPARVAESQVQMECRLFQIVEHGHGGAAARYVIGEVLAIHIDPALVEDGSVVPGRWQPISRLGGPDYLNLADGTLFQLDRPAR